MDAVPPSWSSLVVESQQLPPILVLADAQGAMLYGRTGVVMASQGHIWFRSDAEENFRSGCPVLGRYEAV